MATSREYENITIEQIRPPFASIYGLLIIGVIFFSLFQKLDSNRLIFTACLLVAGLLSAYYLQYSRKRKASLQGTSIVFFVVVWLGVNSFSNRQNIISFADLSINFSLRQEQVHYLALLPLIVIWMLPHNPDTFFGLAEVTQEIAIKSLWKYSLFLIIIIKFFNLPVVFEFAILIPFISEHVKVYKNSKTKPPVLTLYIQQELTDRFSVPLSLLKAVALIMVLFLFNVLQSRLWLLVILGYFLAGFIWTIDTIIPESARGKSEDDIEKKIEEKISSFFESDKEVAKPSDVRRSHEVKEEIILSATEDMLSPEKSAKQHTKEIMVSEPQKLQDSDTNLSVKAFSFGRKVRTEIQKPIYTLNHILSTLSQEDFSTAYRVTRPNQSFDSLSGRWIPPVGLIVIPVQLGDYDYRRAGQILLLGFNQPKEDKTETKAGSHKKEFAMKISDNAIKFGEVVFNMKTLVVMDDDWENIKKNLDVVDPDEDISYTGFASLHDLQDKLTLISDKWIEVRQKAKDATVNFVAGLLGASEPVFLGTDDLEEQNLEYLIEDNHEKDLEKTED